MKTVQFEIGGRTLSIETGRLAKQANGAALVTYGETIVLVTATAARESKPDIDFLPLTVEYQERFYSVGRIPGSFFRREIGRPSEKETLSARFIDRPLRPLFAKGYARETQIIATVLSADQINDPDTLAIIGASSALTISEIPFNGPIAGVRVGYGKGGYILNPTRTQLKESRLNLIVAGSEKAVVMVEGSADNATEDEVLEGIFFGHAGLQPVIAMQHELRAAMGIPKIAVVCPPIDEDLKKKVAAIAAGSMAKVVSEPAKMRRYQMYYELEENLLKTLAAEDDTVVLAKGKEAKAHLHDLKKEMMRDVIVKQGKRIDGRAFDEIRPISCSVATLPRVHGSALFTRGETQVIVTVTLGSGEDEQKVESLYGMSTNPFMLHYNFPPYCVGEVRALRGPSRRDIGHGALAGRGIKAMLPEMGVFPYTIRVVSEVLESNGSSSMATVCGASLSLMDAGVPMKMAVSGIAMGLIKDDDNIVILSDILGDEDHLGDMDFKVVGTSLGITALQMDIKIEGVTRDIMGKALAQARGGRMHILDKMKQAISEPRPNVPEHAPKICSININPEKIRDIIGPSGKTIKALTAEFEVKIDVEDSGKVTIFAPNGIVGQQVVDRIKGLTAEPEIGQIYTGKVQKIVDFGAFVEIMPGVDGLVHISELDAKRVAKVTDILSEGDVVTVKVLEIDQRGKIRLSRKAVLAEMDK